jgi:hypothetical protein
MKRIIALAAALLLSSVALAAAQAPPQPKAPAPAPNKEVHDPDACAHAPATVGKGGGLDVQKQDKRDLSEQLADSNGVICPPQHVDPEMDKAAPQLGARMPVLPPPASPGGNPQVQPK